MRARLKALLGWVFYACSATPFAAFVAVAFWPDHLVREPANIIVVNALIFAAAGVTAVLVKTMAFNAAMALNAVPYAAFLLDHGGTDPARWSANDVEGSVVYVSLYCLIGWGSTAVWLLIRAEAIWRRRRRASRDTGVPLPSR